MLLLFLGDSSLSISIWYFQIIWKIIMLTNHKLLFKYDKHPNQISLWALLYPLQKPVFSFCWEFASFIPSSSSLLGKLIFNFYYPMNFYLLRVSMLFLASLLSSSQLFHLVFPLKLKLFLCSFLPYSIPIFQDDFHYPPLFSLYQWFFFEAVHLYSACE